jgi:hypothetical protein
VAQTVQRIAVGAFGGDHHDVGREGCGLRLIEDEAVANLKRLDTGEPLGHQGRPRPI